MLFRLLLLQTNSLEWLEPALQGELKAALCRKSEQLHTVSIVTTLGCKASSSSGKTSSERAEIFRDGRYHSANRRPRLAFRSDKGDCEALATKEPAVPSSAPACRTVKTSSSPHVVGLPVQKSGS